MEYKQLAEKYQPQPRLPAGYGVVWIDFEADVDLGTLAYTLWYPVRLLTEHEAKTSRMNWHSFYGSNISPPLSYRDRHRAIGYIWRWYRRYGENGLHMPDYAGPCEAGIPGHLYGCYRSTIAQAASRLGLSTKDIHKIRTRTDLKEKLRSGKESRGLFYNYYTISMAHLQAYLDVHGYGEHYVSVAELRKQRSDLPFVVW